ncbi:MAG: type II toxin-antitoxin system RelE family toxin [Candidatus Natronoplasma sp.]
MNIEWTHRALKDLEDLESHIAQRIIDKVEDATDFPDHYLSPLKGYDLYKIRIGDYRAIVSVEDEKMTVVTTDHRKNIYKSLKRFHD